MTQDRTLYTILDETGTKSTITLDKWVADILQKHMPDVHHWVQETYDRVAEKRPQFGRVQKGDLVRAISIREMFQTPSGIELLKEL